MTRPELTDDEWALVEPFLPIGRFGPYPGRLRQQFEGVVWRFRTGSPWRDMPEVHGAWQTVYQRFEQWRDAGVFHGLLEGLIAEAAARGQVDLGLVSVDSTVVRAHHDAAGMVVEEEVLAALQQAADDEKRALEKRGPNRRRPRKKPPTRPARSGAAVADAGGPG